MKYSFSTLGITFFTFYFVMHVNILMSLTNR